MGKGATCISTAIGETARAVVVLEVVAALLLSAWRVGARKGCVFPVYIEAPV